MIGDELVVWEIGILGLYLIFKGFRPAAAASLLSRSGNEGESTTGSPSSTVPATVTGAA